MTDQPTTLLERQLLRWSGWVRRRRRIVLATTALTTILAAIYAVGNLGVNTDTSSLVSDSLDWRARALAYERAFPGIRDGLTVLLEARTPESAEDAARRLALELGADTVAIESVYRPDGGPFFDEYGLLYRDADTLAAVVDRIMAAADLLADIERDPSLAGMGAALENALGASNGSRPGEPDLAPVLGLIAASTFAASEGRFEPLPWSALIDGRLPTAQERRRTILIEPRLEFANRVPGRAAMETVRAAVRRLGLDERHGVAVRLTGSVAIEADELDMAVGGVRQAGLLAAVSVALILFLALRSAWLIAMSLATLLVGLIAASAFAALAIGQLNLISVAFAVLYVGLGIDYALHLCLRYRSRRAEGEEAGRAIDMAVVGVGPSLALSALTTATCFYAFTLTDFTGMAELGLIGGTGMLISFVVTLTVLPAGLAARPLAPALTPLPDGLPALARTVTRHRAAILVVTAASAAVAAAALPRSSFDENPLNLRAPDTEAVQAYRDLLADSVAKPLTVSILEPDAGQAALAASELASLPEVSQARTLAGYLPGDQEAKRVQLARLAGALGPSPGSTPPVRGSSGATLLERALTRLRWAGGDDVRVAARQAYHALRAWRRSLESLPLEEREDRTRALEAAIIGPLPTLLARLRRATESGPLTEALLPPDLKRRWVAETGEHRIEVVPSGMLADTEQLRAFVDAVKAIEPEATGEAVTQIETGRVAARAFRSAFIAGGIITAAILFALLRSVAAAALVVGPLALAAVWTGGLLVAFDMPFNYANVIALPLLLGVGVDNGIHMVHHVRRRPNVHPLMGSTGRAILFASLTTIASFGNLAFAAHVGMATMGRLLSIGMTCVLAATLIVLPSILRSHPSDDSPT